MFNNLGELGFRNVIPIFEKHEDFAVSEILRQRREVGLNRFLVCLSFHPQTTPAKDLIPRLCARYAAVRDAVAASGEDVELSILVQSILGHGWNGKVPLTQETWRHVVLSDGSESPRFCVLDEGFREYTREVIEAVARERPALILLDDDVGIRSGECFCQAHLDAVSDALGRRTTLEELGRACRGDDAAAHLAVAAMRRAHERTILGYAQMIRETIDRVDSSIRCGVCACYAGQWQLRGLVKALAGGTRPLLRVNDAIYSDHKPTVLGSCFILASRVRHRAATEGDVIDEADTFPQNYMSESATVFHAHLTSAMLMGLDGAKLWTSEFQEPVDTGSQRKYERRLRDYCGYYSALRALAPQIRWCGVARPLFTPRDWVEGNPWGPGENAGLFANDWDGIPEISYGLPLRCEEPGCDGIIAITGDEAQWMDDGDVEKALSGHAVVDGIAARHLTERGFAGLSGVESTAGGDDFHFSSERLDDGSVEAGFLWDGTASLLKPVAPEVETLSWFCKGTRFVDSVPEFPAATLFTNRLGGRVAVLGWSFNMPWFKMLRPQRRKILVNILERLAGTPLEMAVETGGKAFVRHGILPNGREIVAVFPCGCDMEEKLPLRLIRNPRKGEVLLADGSWRETAFSRADATTVEFDLAVSCAEPIVMKLTF